MMRWHDSYFVVLVAGFLIVFALSKPSQAESMTPVAGGNGSPASVLERIQRESKEIEQLRSALESPDQSVRVAAFDAMINSGNPTLAELAITTAFASADEATKALAIRAAFTSVQVMEVELIASQDLSENAQHDLTRARQGNSATVRRIEYDYKTGKFASKHVTGGKGQVSGMNISFGSPGCGGSLNNKEGTWEFQGKVRCGQSVFDGKFRLR